MDTSPTSLGGVFVSCIMNTYPSIELVNRLEYDNDESSLFTTLFNDVAWRDEPITMFGKTVLQPRRVAWYGDEHARYTYSGIEHRPLPWIPILQDLRQVVEKQAGASFNSVLCNLYRDGRDSMGYHSDDEPELGSEPVIASFSIGAERTLHFRSRIDHDIPTIKIMLPSMSLLIMRGTTQQLWKHALPKTTRCQSPRINLTFRTVTSLEVGLDRHPIDSKLNAIRKA